MRADEPRREERKGEKALRNFKATTGETVKRMRLAVKM
jgi:hypothetical protein